MSVAAMTTGEGLTGLLDGQRSEEEILRALQVAALARRSLRQELAAAKSARQAREVAGGGGKGAGPGKAR